MKSPRKTRTQSEERGAERDREDREGQRNKSSLLSHLCEETMRNVFPSPRDHERFREEALTSGEKRGSPISFLPFSLLLSFPLWPGCHLRSKDGDMDGSAGILDVRSSLGSAKVFRVSRVDVSCSASWKLGSASGWNLIALSSLCLRLLFLPSSLPPFFPLRAATECLLSLTDIHSFAGSLRRRCRARTASECRTRFPPSLALPVLQC